MREFARRRVVAIREARCGEELLIRVLEIVTAVGREAQADVLVRCRDWLRPAPGHRARGCGLPNSGRLRFRRARRAAGPARSPARSQRHRSEPPFDRCHGDRYPRRPALSQRAGLPERPVLSMVEGFWTPGKTAPRKV